MSSQDGWRRRLSWGGPGGEDSLGERTCREGLTPGLAWGLCRGASGGEELSLHCEVARDFEVGDTDLCFKSRPGAMGRGLDSRTGLMSPEAQAEGGRLPEARGPWSQALAWGRNHSVPPSQAGWGERKPLSRSAGGKDSDPSPGLRPWLSVNQGLTLMRGSDGQDLGYADSSASDSDRILFPGSP